MLASFLASAALIVAASLAVGQALLHLLGRRDASPLAGPVGLALLLCASGIVAGLGGRGGAIAITLAVLVMLAVALPVIRRAGGGFARARSRASEWADLALARGFAATAAPALLAALLAAAFAALPFIVAGRVGILGMGLVNDDMAYHLLMADWIAERFTPEPELIADGYPLGPHGLVAGLAALLGGRSIDAFAGLVVAIPALTALVAFTALSGLRPAWRVGASALVALPYLAAAYLAQEAFKEPIMVLLLLGFVLLAAERPAAEALEPRYRWGRGVAMGAIAAGVIYVYSFPGLAWLAAALVAWGLAELWRGRERGARTRLRDIAAGAAPPVVAGLIAWAAITLPDLGRVLEFTDFRALDPDQAHEGGLGNLRGHLSPLEALGIWPTSEFRLPAGAGALPALVFYAGALVAATGLAIGLVRWLRLHGPAIPAALAGAVVIYAAARGFGTVYTSAKALAIAAPLVALVALGGLLSTGARSIPPGRRSGPRRVPDREHARHRRLARAVLAAAIVVGMAASSFLVLRQAPVGPEDHLDQLAQLRPLVAGEELLFLGRDNFVLYGLRGSRPHTHVRNFYNPYEVAPNDDLERVRAKFDFDSVDADTLARFPSVLTTRAAYASGPPPAYEPVAATDGYVLWRRGGNRAGREPVEPDLKPGATLECDADGAAGPALAAWLPREPVLAGDGDWRPGPEIDHRSPATATLALGPGDWELSLQYHASAPLRLAGRGLDVELPGNLGYRGAVPFWPAGRIEGHPGGPVRIEASVAPPTLVGRLVGARTVAGLGTIAATPHGPGYGRARDSVRPPFPGSSARLSGVGPACGRYADWTSPDGGADQPSRVWR